MLNIVVNAIVDNYDEDNVALVSVNMDFHTRYYKSKTQPNFSAIDMVGDVIVFCRESPDEITALIAAAKRVTMLEIRQTMVDQRLGLGE